MQNKTNFIVIDTEGKEELTEIAIISHDGQLIYEAFVKNHRRNQEIRFSLKDRLEIVTDFAKIAQEKLIIGHYAQHDIDILKNSFNTVGKSWPNLTFQCSFLLAKTYFRGLPSYSLEYLSKYLNLKVDGRYFNQDFAHTARYDAQFTHQLYQKIMEQQLKEILRLKPNPFGTNRVDSPFQTHIDLKEIYENEFAMLKSIIADIKQDNSNQSKGVVVIGEAGSGKTHLTMRLAQELLTDNRLLFIRQPNHPETILYHIYSRILESFIEIVKNSGYSQLECLLAKSFSKIYLKEREQTAKKEETILKLLSEDYLNIYKVLGTESSEKKRKNWQTIEKTIIQWWHKTYGFSGYATEIVKGLIKFCSYSDRGKRDLIKRWLAGNELEPSEVEAVGLSNWSAEMSQEDFSLQAIAVFGKLSMMDEPLMIVFDQLEGLKNKETLLNNFGEAVKEMFTHTPNSLMIFNLFPDRWQHFEQFFDHSVIDRISQYRIILSRPSQEQLYQLLRLRAETHEIEIESLFTQEELNVILAQNSVRSVLNCASDHYKHRVNDIPLLPIPQPQPLPENFEAEVRLEIERLKDEIAFIKGKLGHQEDKIIEQHQTINSIHPVQEYLAQHKPLLEQAYEKQTIISDSDDFGKLKTILEAFRAIRVLELDFLRLGKKELPEHLLIKAKEGSFVIGFLHNSGNTFTSRIKNFNELVVHHRQIRFGLLRDQRQPLINSKVGKEEIEKLKNAENGKFTVMTKENRVGFELIYKLVTDIENKDIEIELADALKTLESCFDHWIITMVKEHFLLS
ncbi:MAG: exonuclease [Beggiatoa sp. IS2]|nr:MAG: exonuclease [Beggiatoa sp. IS2]